MLGAWEIKVNGTDITTSGQVEEFAISDSQLEYITSDYIQAGKIAPNGQAYFDIVIDPTDTDVSIVYQIDISSDTEANADIELISASDYFQKDGETDKITNTTTFQNGNSYTSVIPVSKITQGYKNYVRLYFKWINEEANNETDATLAETENATISVPLQINLKQYTGEVIGNAS